MYAYRFRQTLHQHLGTGPYSFSFSFRQATMVAGTNAPCLHTSLHLAWRCRNTTRSDSPSSSTSDRANLACKALRIEGGLQITDRSFQRRATSQQGRRSPSWFWPWQKYWRREGALCTISSSQAVNCLDLEESCCAHILPSSLGDSIQNMQKMQTSLASG